MEKKWDYLNEPVVGIIAPAGYGKTEEIAEAVKICEGKQLILTHTRAGVAALRDRMKRKNICPVNYEIDTIASFGLKWCKAYPSTAQVKIPEKINDINYLDIYNGTARVFSYSWAQSVLKQSYSGIFVDEYQDCTESQHAIFMELVNIIPIRIYGDPLQGIFYRIKNFESVVYLSTFPNKQKTFSQHNGGFFQCDEKKDLTEVEEIISSIESNEKEKKAFAFLEIMKNMINGIQAELGSYINNLKKGKTNFDRISKHKDFGIIIEHICNENSPQPVLDALRWFGRNNDFKIYRKELFYRIGKTYAYMVEEDMSLHEAVEALSSQKYFTEKRFDFPRLSSRTVLTKGLEFDCVIIDARDKMDVRDFYVAMTRAKKYIYIISDAKQISFSGVQY